MCDRVLEEKISRWEAQRAIKNLMGKYVLTMLLEQRDMAFDRFWSKEADVCLGINEGWYAGADAIRGYYTAQAKRTAAESELLANLFPEKAAGLTPEQKYGTALRHPATGSSVHSLRPFHLWSRRPRCSYGK